MKCTKCGYTSFDFNQACPKCKKDQIEIRSRMNHPDYMPTPPSFPSLKSTSSGDPKTFSAEETLELQFSDGEDLDIELDSTSELDIDESAIDLSLEDETDDLTLNFDDLSEDKPAEAAQSKVEEEEFEFAMDLVSPDHTDSTKPASPESYEEEEPTSLLDLDDLSTVETKTAFGVDIIDEEDQLSLGQQDTVLHSEQSVGDVELTSEDVGEVKSNSSNLEVLDLDLDLEKSDK